MVFTLPGQEVTVLTWLDVAAPQLTDCERPSMARGAVAVSGLDPHVAKVRLLVRRRLRLTVRRWSIAVTPLAG